MVSCLLVGNYMKQISCAIIITVLNGTHVVEEWLVIGNLMDHFLQLLSLGRCKLAIFWLKPLQCTILPLDGTT